MAASRETGKSPLCHQIVFRFLPGHRHPKTSHSGRTMAQMPGTQTPRRAPRTARQSSALRRRCRGAGGDSPRQSKHRISPFPAGEGGRGNRGQKNLYGGWSSRESRGTYPFWHRKPQGHPWTRGQALRRVPHTTRQPANLPAQAQGGAGGDSPRRNKHKISPFPGVGRALCERGSGG